MLEPGLPRTTPGIVRVRLTKLRPFRGSDSIVLPSTVTLRSDEPVCTSGVSAWIVTASVIWPSSSLKSVRTFWSTPTWTFDMLVFLKPPISAVTL